MQKEVCALFQSLLFPSPFATILIYLTVIKTFWGDWLAYRAKWNGSWKEFSALYKKSDVSFTFVSLFLFDVKNFDGFVPNLMFPSNFHFSVTVHIKESIMLLLDYFGDILMSIKIKQFNLYLIDMKY